MIAKQSKVPMLDVHTVSFMLALRNPSSDTELETNCYLLEAIDDLLGFHLSDLRDEVQNMRKQKRGRLSIPGSKRFKQNIRRHLAVKICASLNVVRHLNKDIVSSFGMDHVQNCLAAGGFDPGQHDLQNVALKKPRVSNWGGRKLTLVRS